MKTQNPSPNPEAENANGEVQPPERVLEILRLYESLSKGDRKILSAQLSNILFLDGAIMAAVSILMMEHEYIQLMEPEEQQHVRPVLNRLYKRVSDAYLKVLRPRVSIAGKDVCKNAALDVPFFAVEKSAAIG